MEENNGNQPNDPKLLAAQIVTLASQGEVPSRLVFADDARQWASAKVDQLRQEISQSADRDDARLPERALLIIGPAVLLDRSQVVDRPCGEQRECRGKRATQFGQLIADLRRGRVADRPQALLHVDHHPWRVRPVPRERVRNGKVSVTHRSQKPLHLWRSRRASSHFCWANRCRSPTLSILGAVGRSALRRRCPRAATSFPGAHEPRAFRRPCAG